MARWLTAALAPAHRSVAIAIALLIATIVLGGGGSPNPSTELWLQMLAACAALAWLWLPGAFRLPQDRSIWLVAGLSVFLPILHLIPLPPAIWHGLPGRETEIAALDLVGSANSWQPLSTSRPRTLASLLAILPPVLLMLMTASLNLSERRWLITALVAMVLVSALLGAAQLAAGSAAPRMYSASNPGVITGFHANRNAVVDLFLIGVAAVAVLAAHMRGAQKEWRTKPAAHDVRWLSAAAILMVLAAILTASRAGIALIIPTLVASWFIVKRGGRTRAKRGLIWGALGIIAAAILIAGLLRYNTAMQFVASRFDLPQDGRPDLWKDTIFAIQQYWPFGSGMGTFVPTFIALEPLEVVDPSVPNRAHNDYLELTLEAGFFGIAVLTLTALIVASMALKAWRAANPNRAQILFALTVFMIIAAHSVVDYPMRSMTLASVTAMATGLLASRTRTPE